MAGRPRIANQQVDDRMAKLAEQLTAEKDGKKLNTVDDLKEIKAPVKSFSGEKERKADEAAVEAAKVAAEAEAQRIAEIEAAKQEGVEKGKIVAKEEIKKEQIINDIPDYLKEDSTFKAAKAAPVDKEKEADEKIKTLLEVESQYKEITSDPFIAAIIDWRKSGGEDINEFANKVGIPSFDGKSEEEKYSFYLKATDPTISEDDMEEAIADFSSLPAVERRAKLKAADAEIAKVKEEKLKTFKGSSKEKEEARKAQEAFRNEKINEGVKVLDLTLAEMKDKEVYGYKLTPSDVAQIHEFSLARTAIKTDDKGNFAGFDIDKTIDEALFLIPSLRRKILLENLNLGKQLGAEAEIAKRKRAAGIGSDNLLIGADKTESGVDKAIADVRASLRKKGKMEQSVNR